MAMSPLGFVVELEALPGKEAAVAQFLEEAKLLVDDEPGTLSWFAYQRGPELLSAEPVITPVHIIANRITF
jgi:hypothetical protein